MVDCSGCQVSDTRNHFQKYFLVVCLFPLEAERPLIDIQRVCAKGLVNCGFVIKAHERALVPMIPQDLLVAQ